MTSASRSSHRAENRASSRAARCARRFGSSGKVPGAMTMKSVLGL
jgi:hypothetical protein